MLCVFVRVCLRESDRGKKKQCALINYVSMNTVKSSQTSADRHSTLYALHVHAIAIASLDMDM